MIRGFSFYIIICILNLERDLYPVHILKQIQVLMGAYRDKLDL